MGPVTEQEEDVLWAAYLGMRVLRTMLNKSGMAHGASVAQTIINEIEELRPEYPARATLRGTDTVQ